jgi:predicted small secreted protein
MKNSILIPAILALVAVLLAGGCSGNRLTFSTAQ